jgi:hypothetical protein
VHEMFVTGAERLMIGDHRPVWNAVVHGFGQQMPGRARLDGARSAWDELHPGRPWAAQMRSNEKADSLREAVRRHFAIEGPSVGYEQSPSMQTARLHVYGRVPTPLLGEGLLGK